MVVDVSSPLAIHNYEPIGYYKMISLAAMISFRTSHLQ